METNKILDYINIAINNLKDHLSGLRDGNANEKLRLELRVEIFEEIKEAFEWKTSSEEKKQARRILQIAIDREQGFDVENQIKEVNIYSKIKETLPYIQAVNYKIGSEEEFLVQDLLVFCIKWIDIIDNNSPANKRQVKFPPKKDIAEAFRSFVEYIKPNKIPSLKVYYQPEVSQKIEDLLSEFNSL